jgi:hypothetical protein
MQMASFKMKRQLRTSVHRGRWGNQGMKIRCCLLLLMTLCGDRLLHAQAGPTVLVTTDLDCNWKFDGVSQGHLTTDDAKVLQVSLGEHLIQASSQDGQDNWKSTITLERDGQKIVNITLSKIRQQRLERESFAQHPIWIDPVSGLMWTRKDNGSHVFWQQASNYCNNLQLGGFSDWRLPSIDELEAVYDDTQPGHIKGGISLTFPWIWSSSEGRRTGESYFYNFGRGGSSSSSGGSSTFALCVRRSSR